MKKIIFLICSIFLCIGIFAQEKPLRQDSIIYLKEVPVYAVKNLATIKSDNKKGDIHVRGKGKTSLVTKIDIDKNKVYNIIAVELFFNYQWQGFPGEGFYIKPLLFTSKDDKPDSDCIKSDKLYFVSKEINEVIHINLSDFNIKIKDAKSFFIGIEFVDADGKSKYEDFNVTMIPVRRKLNTSFVKGSCKKCTFSPFYLNKKTGLALKHKIYYKKKNAK